MLQSFLQPTFCWSRVLSEPQNTDIETEADVQVCVWYGGIFLNDQYTNRCVGWHDSIDCLSKDVRLVQKAEAHGWDQQRICSNLVSSELNYVFW